MIFRVEFNQFKEITRESSTGLIFVQAEKHEDGTGIYTLYTSHGPFVIKTIYVCETPQDIITFEESYVRDKPNVVILQGIEDKDIILTIAGHTNYSGITEKEVSDDIN